MLNDIIDIRGAKLREYARDPSQGPRERLRTAVIVLHGGGYFMKSITEYEPVALRLLADGRAAFTLDYSLLPAKYPTQLLELASAVAYIRSNAAKYGIDPNKIALCGFSAGAHLASCLANSWHKPWLSERLGLSPGDIRPNAVIYSYSPSTIDLPDCLQMFKNLSGESGREALLELSPAHGVGSQTPPGFIWQTVTDEMVSVEHSLVLAEAFRKAGVPFELHLFPEGMHAMSLCDEECAFTEKHLNPHAGQWFSLAENWLDYTLG
ncbi:MAG: alpha/beta hydrolase [Oscillospiraceae bacterium]|jgi:acetyl esterase/lipase